MIKPTNTGMCNEYSFSFLDSVAFNIEFVYSNFVELFMYLCLVSPPSGVICKGFRLRTASLERQAGPPFTIDSGRGEQVLSPGLVDPFGRGAGTPFHIYSFHIKQGILSPRFIQGHPGAQRKSWCTLGIGQPSHHHGKGPPPPLGRGPSVSRKRRYLSICISHKTKGIQLHSIFSGLTISRDHKAQAYANSIALYDWHVQK